MFATVTAARIPWALPALPTLTASAPDPWTLSGAPAVVEWTSTVSPVLFPWIVVNVSVPLTVKVSAPVPAKSDRADNVALVRSIEAGVMPVTDVLVTLTFRPVASFWSSTAAVEVPTVEPIVTVPLIAWLVPKPIWNKSLPPVESWRVVGLLLEIRIRELSPPCMSKSSEVVFVVVMVFVLLPVTMPVPLLVTLITSARSVIV